MNDLRNLTAHMYFLCAKMARWCAVLIAFCGFSYAILAGLMEREYLGLSTGKLFLVGFLGSVVMFSLSVVCVTVGNFMSQHRR